MRYALFMGVCLIALAAGLPGPFADQPQTILVTPLPQAPVAAAAPAPTPVPITPPNIVVTAAPWDTYGKRQYGPNYQSVVPVEMKSDTPDVIRTWDPNAHPGNGNHLTPEGMACATDADCETPLGCFHRADSGQIERNICAIPPGK